MNRAHALALLAAAAAAGPQCAAAQSAPAVVRMVAVTGQDFTIGYFASELGYFKAQNLDVQTTQVPGGGAATAALIGGSFELAITNVGSLSNAFVRGLPVTMLTGGALYSSSGPSAFLCSGSTAPIRTAKELTGKTIGVSTLHDLAQSGVMSWIDGNGGDSRAVTYVELPSSDIAPSVQRGRIDAGLLLNPRYFEVKETVHLIGTPYDAIAKQFMISAAVVIAPWLEANRPLARRITAALHAAAVWGNEHQRESAELVSKYTKVAPELVAQTPRAPLAPNADPRMIQPPIDALAKYAFIPRRFAAAELIAKGV